MDREIKEKSIGVKKYLSKEYRSQVWLGKIVALIISLLSVVLIMCIGLELIEGSLIFFVLFLAINMFVVFFAKNESEEDKEVLIKKSKVYKILVKPANHIAFMLGYFPAMLF